MDSSLQQTLFPNDKRNKTLNLFKEPVNKQQNKGSLRCENDSHENNVRRSKRIKNRQNEVMKNQLDYNVNHKHFNNDLNQEMNQLKAGPSLNPPKIDLSHESFKEKQINSLQRKMESKGNGLGSHPISSIDSSHEFVDKRPNKKLTRREDKTRAKENNSDTNLSQPESNESKGDEISIQFNQVLNTLNRINNERENIEFICFDEEQEIDCREIVTNDDNVIGISFTEESKHSETNEYDSDLIIRGCKDIHRKFSLEESIRIKNELKSISFPTKLNHEQICWLIQSFSHTLSEIINKKKFSLWNDVFKKSAFNGIAEKIKTTMFAGWQSNYICGCLDGLFKFKYTEKTYIFGVLYPETLIRILMYIKDLNYEEALSLMDIKS